MNRPELYRKTVDILYEAYFNDTLEHGNTCGCAVGNLVAAGCGYEVREIEKPGWGGLRIEWSDYRTAKWGSLFYTPNDEATARQQVDTDALETPEVMEQINSTGYPWQELAKIEYAFETASKGRNAEDYIFNGLVAVLDVLKQIHEVEDDAGEMSRFARQRAVRAGVK